MALLLPTSVSCHFCARSHSAGAGADLLSSHALPHHFAFAAMVILARCLPSFSLPFISLSMSLQYLSPLRDLLLHSARTSNMRCGICILYYCYILDQVTVRWNRHDSDGSFAKTNSNVMSIHFSLCISHLSLLIFSSGMVVAGAAW